MAGLTIQIVLFLLVLVAALVLFALEKFSVDVIALGVLAVITLLGLVPRNEAFAGFGSDTVILILGLLILTAALERTGVVELTGRAILRRTGSDPTRLLVIITAVSAVLGAVMSNTATVAFFLPIVMGLARRARLSASRLLMPLAFASILSSSVTLVSTSTNIIISGLMTRYKMAPMSMFEMAPVGIPITLAGLVYLLLIGKRMIPDRADSGQLSEDFGLRSYLTEILIMPGSFLIGKTLAESGLGRDLDLTVMQVVREKSKYMAPDAKLCLQEGDILLVEGSRVQILKIKDTSGIDIKADVKLSDPELLSKDMGLIEVILMPRSPLIGRTLKGIRFRENYGLQVLAINRGEGTLRRKISQVVLRMGDVLLLQGHRANLSILQEDKTFQILGVIDDRRPNVRRAPLAISIFAGVLILSALNLIPLSLSVIIGVVVAFLTRCITPEEAYREVEWKALILIGSMLAVGTAMEYTGTAKFLAGHLAGLGGSSHPYWLLSAFFIVTVLLAQPMSNQGAAVVIIPIAIQTALHLGFNPRTFAMMVAVAAPCSYLTPLEPACLMVYGPGRYKFVDFLKVGSLLTVVIFVISIFLVPLIWPLH
ncbi:MAG: SLC13 family permease [Omnitrophica WOR_2 bacterium]